MVVHAVLDGSAAERAGVRQGDYVVAIDDEPVTDAIQLLAISRSRRSGDTVAFHVERVSRPLELAGIAPPLPPEASEVGEVELGMIEASGQRLRAIVNVPRSRGPHPAILYLQDLRPRSCEYPLDASAPLRRLVDGWTQAGFLVLRVERSGVGDSEGPSCAVTGLDVELDTYVAGIDHLLSRSDVDTARIFLFGQSFGGMVAPLLVALRPVVAGVMVYGTSGERWHDCVIDTTRRQLGLTGISEERLRAKVALWSELYGLVCREGLTPALAFEKRPHLRVLQSMECVGETLSGRHASLYQELDWIDLFSAWGAIGKTHVPVLVGHGEYDWILHARGKRGHRPCDRCVRALRRACVHGPRLARVRQPRKEPRGRERTLGR